MMFKYNKSCVVYLNKHGIDVDGVNDYEKDFLNCNCNHYTDSNSYEIDYSLDDCNLNYNQKNDCENDQKRNHYELNMKDT